MSTRYPVAFAVSAALAALAASGAQAVEATQWNPAVDAPPGMAVNTDGLRQPTAWTVGRGEATEFHDGVARDTMSTRADVRQDLAQAKQRGVLADAGEAGATDRVWRRRAAFATSKRDHELAAARSSPDPIAVIAAMETEPPVDHGRYALAPDDTVLRMPANPPPPAPEAPRPDSTPVALAPPLEGDMRHEDLVMAAGPRVLENGTGPLADSTTVEVR
jgi:hypothetical protein